MKTFWQQNKLLIAIFLFAVATTSYLYTASYTSGVVPIFDESATKEVQPSAESPSFGQNDKKSVEENIQVDVGNAADPGSETHETTQELMNATPELNVPVEKEHTEETDDSEIFVEDAKELIAVTLERYYTGYDEDSFEIEEGSTVYEAMLWMQENRGLQIEGTQYGNLGFFVESIGGIENDKRGGKYWIYYINGAKAQMGISQYVIQPNDIITWKYEHEEI